MDRERGFALVAAVALSLVLALVAAGASRETRVTVAVARAAIDAAAASAAAEAGVWRAAYALAAGARGVPVAGARAPAVDGVEVRWRVDSERGRVDLNAADPDALRGTAAMAGAPDPDAFAAGVLAARARLAAAGIAWRLDARAFDDVGGAAPLVPRAVWARLAPLLTVHGADEAEVFRVIAEADGPGAARAAIEALVAIDPRATPVVTILGWRAVPPAP